jgi:predicted dinucleotide-binding enzyme
VPSAAAAAEVILLSTPWTATEDACRSMGDIRGKIVIDCTNPLGMSKDGFGLVVGHTISGGEMVAGWCRGAFVFKSFNQTGFEIMADPTRFQPKPVMFVAGDDARHKPTVLGLVADAGFEARDAGPLASARLLEPYAMVWIDQVMKRAADRDFAFALARPS